MRGREGGKHHVIATLKECRGDFKIGAQPVRSSDLHAQATEALAEGRVGRSHGESLLEGTELGAGASGLQAGE